MPETKLKEIADHATMIVSGYAFTWTENGLVRVLNLENADKLFVKPDGDTIIQHQGVVSDSDMRKFRSI